MATLRDSLQRNTRSALAVDFGADFVAVRYAPPDADWAELGAVSVEAADFAAQMTALADIARETTGGDMRAELWLPASQIVNLEIDDQSRIEFLARRSAVTHLAEAVGIAADQLSFDLAPPDSQGRRSACATETSTVDEARSHASAWGFAPTIITTRHAGPAFTRPPRFDVAASHRAALPVVAAAAAVVVLLLGVSSIWWMEDGPHKPPAVNLETVATAPAPAPEPVSPETEVALDATESTPTQMEAPAPSASPEVEVSAPEGSETPLDFSVTADTPPLPSPEQEAPLAVQDETRVANDGAVTGAMTPDESVEPLVARDFTADQTPVAPPPPDLATDDATETTSADLTPEADTPPLGDIAVAAASPASGGERAALPVAPLEDRAPAPDTDVAPSDPAEIAEEAEKWAEAEGAAEAEAGANVPTSLTEDGAPADEGAAGPEEFDLAQAEAEPEALFEEADADTAADGDIDAEGIAPDPESMQVAALPQPAPALAGDTGPALAESDDFDDIDLGPGPGSVLRAPQPVHRPAALDMTPSELAVLTAPAPGHRPASIKPRPKPIVANTRTASAPNRGRPSGPGLSRAATLKDVIPLDDLNLLGTFGQGKSRRALLRMPSGEIVRVSRGDVVQGWVVGKIEILSMRITRGGEARTLPLAR